jgi:hypothetical protein
MDWFKQLQPVLDVMPDQVCKKNQKPVLQVAAPNRRSLWHWYIADSAKPANQLVLHPVSESYFDAVWRNFFPEIKSVVFPFFLA